MNISLFIDKDSWLHRLDPRTKIIASVIVFAIALCFNDPLWVVCVTGATLAVVLSAGVFRTLWKVKYLILLLFLFSALLWPIFSKGPTTIFSRYGLTVSRESLFFGIAMGLRLSTFVMTGLLFIATTRNEDITSGLIKMHLPYPVAFALSTALRLVPTFAGAGAVIVQAQISRGLDLESKNVLTRFGKLIPLAVPMFIQAIRYTNLLAMALESKGFTPEGKRTFYHEPAMNKKDWLVLAFLTILLAACIYARAWAGAGAVMPGRL